MKKTKILRYKILDTAKEYRKRHPEWRWGQSVFNAAEDLYPIEVNKLRTTEFDCYYDDQRVSVFLDELTKE